jgi:hypothetical protein
MKQTAFLLLIGAALAFQKPPEPEHRPLALPSPVQDKNFYLLSLVERTPAVREAFKTDPALARMAAGRRGAVEHAAASCGAGLECNVAAFLWSDSQIAEGALALADLYRSSAAVRSLTDGPLRSAGLYVRFQELSGPDLLAGAWSECLRGVDRAIEVYGLGQAPRYPAIDSITYDAKAAPYPSVVQNLVALLQSDPGRLDLAFSASLRFALELLMLNDRNEAGRFEPMETGENAAAFRRARSIEWNRYPYTVIVVPGSGNDRPGVRLSPSGKLRDEIAVQRYREGKAPFLLVSGGFVHPSQTEFCEAIEMKRDLMTRFGIPEDAIIVDPHARHTTTNMRNAARLLYRYALPFDRKALVTTDLAQSQTIETPAFAKRCVDELGYVPFRLVGRTSPFDLEFLPTRDSLHAGPRDPLDP